MVVRGDGGRLMFFSPAFSDVPRPITVKVCHIIENLLNFIIQVQQFTDASRQKIWGQKHAKTLFDFIQPPTLIASISKTARDIQNCNTNVSRSILPAF